MIGRTNSLSGGAADLGFSVVASSSSSPPVAAENRIWVKDVNMTDWCFSTTQPGNPSSGLVWFQTGKSSNIAFSVLKDKIIMVYPLSAFYYNGSGWEVAEVEIYQNGSWEKWIQYVYAPYYENIFTGVSYDYLQNTGSGGSIPSIIQGSEYEYATISIENYNSGYGFYNRSGLAVTSNIDITGYNSANLKYSDLIFGNNQDNDPVYFFVSSASNSFDKNSSQAISLPSGSSGIALSTSIDISDLSNDWYIGIGVSAAKNEQVTTSIKVLEITLE